MFYSCRDGATIVGATEGVLRESEEVLERAKECMPQYEIDGLRNIWIVKPGNKSKGIGAAITQSGSPNRHVNTITIMIIISYLTPIVFLAS